MATSIGISARLSRSSKKQDLQYAFNSNSTALVSKLRQDGQLNTVENVMHAIEQVSTLLTSGYDGQIKDSILNMCQHLKVYGACLEVLYKEQLDRAFVVFRNSSQDGEKLDYISRLHLLELIELRANQWKGTDVMSQYYRKKGHLENDTASHVSDSISSISVSECVGVGTPLQIPLLGPGEIMKSSGKFSKPTRIPGKNYCKDEVVIRNADSGKVNPGAKERLVQITGANESSINHAKQLIEDTIRRNASPIRDPNSGVGTLAGSSSSIASSASDEVSAPSGGASNTPRAPLFHSLSTSDASVGEYKYTVTVRGHTIKITGLNLDLVRESKLVLDEYFSGVPINGASEFFDFETFPRSPSSANLEEDANAMRNGEEDDDKDDEDDDDNVNNDNKQQLAPETMSEYKPLRRPNIEEPMTPASVKTSTKNSKVSDRFVYSMDFLARMAMSPLCVAPPPEWARIQGEHPSIARKVVEVFDAEQYLSNKATIQHVLCTSASDESILSGSSV